MHGLLQCILPPLGCFYQCTALGGQSSDAWILFHASAGDVADEVEADLLLLSSEAVHSKVRRRPPQSPSLLHATPGMEQSLTLLSAQAVDANLLAEFVSCPGEF